MEFDICLRLLFLLLGYVEMNGFIKVSGGVGKFVGFDFVVFCEFFL